MTQDSAKHSTASAAGEKSSDIPGLSPLFALAEQVKNWSQSMMAISGPATDLAFASAGAQTQNPEHRAAIMQAGAMVRQMREASGLTLQEVSKALDLSDPALLESAESGSAALPFEVILRLASVIGRNDPAAAMMGLTRAYNPALWKTLDQAGVGRFIVQAGREREIANIYRASDDARRLSDDEFAKVLEFTRQAFNMAVNFRLAGAPPAPSPAKP